MISKYKFEYGNKRIQFNENNLFVEYVNNIKELTYYEEMLGNNNFAVYLTEHKEGGKLRYVKKMKWALVTTSDLLDKHYRT